MSINRIFADAASPFEQWYPCPCAVDGKGHPDCRLCEGLGTIPESTLHERVSLPALTKEDIRLVGLVADDEL